MPGSGYFDDVAGKAHGEGFTQMVVFGAGYDTRAYRINSLKENIRIFEINRPETSGKKTAVLVDIFGHLPGHVAFVPYEIDEGNTWVDLESAGYSPEQKTLFVLEGLVMYLPGRPLRSCSRRSPGMPEPAVLCSLISSRSRWPTGPRMRKAAG